jgi:hypothetical protein
MANFTETQGRYLAFINAYIRRHGYPPAESEIAAAMCVSPPSVNMMVKTLEKKGLILRQPGQARALQILIPEDEIPAWNHRKGEKRKARAGKPADRPKPTVKAPPAKLYVLSVYLKSGPISKTFASKLVLRVIEIRGDQTLEQLHKAILLAHDRSEDQMYQFQFGKRPFDPDGPVYGIGDPKPKKKVHGNPRTTTLDDLDLKPERAFGYWFDFNADWFHQIDVERIEQAIPTVTYPRVIKRVGKSPPQYGDE